MNDTSKIILVLLVIIVAMVLWHNPHPDTPPTPPLAIAPTPNSVTQIGPRARLYSVEHDGHTFVVYYDHSQGSGLSHHPDCRCLK